MINILGILKENASGLLKSASNLYGKSQSFSLQLIKLTLNLRSGALLHTKSKLMIQISILVRTFLYAILLKSLKSRPTRSAILIVTLLLLCPSYLSFSIWALMMRKSRSSKANKSRFNSMKLRQNTYFFLTEVGLCRDSESKKQGLRSWSSLRVYLKTVSSMWSALEVVLRCYLKKVRGCQIKLLKKHWLKSSPCKLIWGEPRSWKLCKPFC